jgi:hypothetical protein
MSEGRALVRFHDWRAARDRKASDTGRERPLSTHRWPSITRLQIAIYYPHPGAAPCVVVW